jgi:outer membrane murein-binding lipoprotein Lpp
MKGVEQHLAEVREEIHDRLGALEESSRQKIGETRENVEASLSRLAADTRELRRQLDAVAGDMEALRGEIAEAASGGAKAAQSIEALTRQLGRLRSDFESLDTELRESVRQLVGESFSTVESTVLSALDAVQEEIVYGVWEPSDRTRPLQPRPTDRQPAPSGPRSVSRSRDNIISMAPLFAGLPKKEGGESGEDSAEPGGEGEDGGEHGDGAGS